MQSLQINFYFYDFVNLIFHRCVACVFDNDIRVFNIDDAAKPIRILTGHLDGIIFLHSHPLQPMQVILYFPFKYTPIIFVLVYLRMSIYEFRGINQIRILLNDILILNYEQEACVINREEKNRSLKVFRVVM